MHFLAGTYCKTGEEPGCPSRKCRRLSTGLNSLDKFTKGLANGDLMVVGGYKEQGKTAFALSLVNHICLEKQVPTAFFSLNSSKEDIFMRLIGNRALVEWSFLQKKQIPPNQWDKAMQAYKEVFSAPLFVEDTPVLSVSQLYLRACLLAADLKKQGKKLGFIVVDSAHLLCWASGLENESKPKQKIGKTLKSLARVLQVPVLALPYWADRGAYMLLKNEFLENWKAADVLGFLRREFYFRPEDVSLKNQISFNLVKNSYGPLKKLDFAFCAPYRLYTNSAPEVL